MRGTLALLLVLNLAAPPPCLARKRGRSRRHLTRSRPDDAAHPLSARTHAAAEVHAFYYLWYGTPGVDGAYTHWDHEVLPHWTPSVNAEHPSVGARHAPELGLTHSPFYPERGPYSSANATVLAAQFAEMVEAGITVAVVSWWGRPDVVGASDSQGVSTDARLPAVLEAAAAAGLGVAFHLEPYPGRTVVSVRDDLAYLYASYAAAPALHNFNATSSLPTFYVYDSYHIAPHDWQRLLTKGGDLSVRGTALDGKFIGLWLHRLHGDELYLSGFDGFYTYFASDGFSYGATPGNWNTMCRYARQKGLVCALSVAPGYDDSRIRPWNGGSTRPRAQGAYYDFMWSEAVRAHPDVVTVTSYNEWGEGTQIEAAAAGAAYAPPPDLGPAAHAAPDDPETRQAWEGMLQAERAYSDYEGLAPSYYLDRTRHWADRLHGSAEPDHADHPEWMVLERHARMDPDHGVELNRHRERDAEEMHQRWVDEERFWEDVGDEESEFGRLGGDGEL